MTLALLLGSLAKEGTGSSERNTVSNQTEHQKYVDLTIAYFRERGITCKDYELLVGHAAVKRPDLFLPDFETLIEVKTFTRQERERLEAQRISQEFLAGKVSTYWPPTFFDRFAQDLKHSRKKFRVSPDYHTAVIFYDLHSDIHKQSPEHLLLGQEYWKIIFAEDEPQNATAVGPGRKERQLRKKKNNEIGAVVFPIGRNAFKIFHNSFADPIRRINPDIFALPEDEHFEYIDDNGQPQIIPLERE